jgi:hypothetical protein
LRRIDFVKQWYDKSATGRSFFPRDEVLILLPSDTLKMLVHWKGPYRVTEKIKPDGVNYKVNVCHINILREYKFSILQAVDRRDDIEE